MTIALLSAANAAAAEKVVVQDVDSHRLEGELAGLSGREGVITLRLKDGQVHKIALEEVLSVSFLGREEGGYTDKSYLMFGEETRLVGDLREAGPERISVTSAATGWLEVKRGSVSAWVRALPAEVEARGEIEKLLAGERTSDRVIFANGDFAEGAFERIADADIILSVEGPEGRPAERKLPLVQVAAVAFATRKHAPAAGTAVILACADGSRFTGVLREAELKKGMVAVETPYREFLVRLEQIAALRPKESKLVFLSQLEVNETASEEKPYLGGPREVIFGYRKDTNAKGGEIRVGNDKYERGLGVHSYSKLVFPLRQEYRTFLAVVGFDDMVAKPGSAAYRVLLDGESRLEGKLDAGKRFSPFRLDVSGAEELALIVDYGDDDSDRNDFVNWAHARLIRK